MRILITNDDGYQAKGINTLVRIMRRYGEVVVVAPKTVQSGMSMAVTMGHKPIAVKKISESDGEQWWYLDGTPASCVKFGIDNVMASARPDLVLCGINHGSNAATATLYSGTVGAAMEGAINGVLSVAVSLDDFSSNADFSIVEQMFPEILDKILQNSSRKFGSFYNINFPNCKASEAKGVRVCNMAYVHWEDEYRNYNNFMRQFKLEPRPEDLEYLHNAEPGSDIYIMVGDLVVNEGNSPASDHLLLQDGYITVTPQKLDCTDYEEMKRLCDIMQ